MNIDKLEILWGPENRWVSHKIHGRIGSVEVWEVYPLCADWTTWQHFFQW